MNNSINCAGFIEMLRNSNDDFEPYGCSEVNEAPENISARIQAKQAGLNNDLGVELD